MTGTYNYGLVALSVLIAMLASYAALDLAGRTRAARGGAEREPGRVNETGAYQQVADEPVGAHP